MVMALTDPRHQQLLDWEMTPPAQRDPNSREQLAKTLGVTARALRQWREKPEFQAAWREAFNETAGSKERVKQLLDTLFEDATNGAPERRAQSAKLYWDISRQIAPPEPEPEASRHAADLSDAELVELLSDAALAELEARGLVVKVREVA